MIPNFNQDERSLILSGPSNNTFPEKIPLSDNLISKRADLTAKTTRSSFKTLIEKIKHVASFILTVSFSALLFWVNPSLFAIGFISGIVLNDHVKNAIQKIKDVWKSQKIAGTLVGGFACLLSMPVTLAAASLLWSAHLGAQMTEATSHKVHPVRA